MTRFKSINIYQSVQNKSIQIQLMGDEQHYKNVVKQEDTMKSILKNHKSHLLTGTVLSFIIIGGIYFSGNSEAVSNNETAPVMAVPVTVNTLKEQDVRLWSNFSGRLQAVDVAEIRPEVNGRITELRFKDGQQVKKGDVLLVIDPRPYEARVSIAEANLAIATSNVEFTRKEKERAEDLMKSQTISQRVYDERTNAVIRAEAAVKSANAELDQAHLDLEHAYVRSPISGRISRAEITVGNLVQNGASAPLLTTVVANESVYADFEVDERTYIKSVHNEANENNNEGSIPVELVVGEDTENRYRGTIYSFDNQIDPASGTIRARAKFNNTDGTLVPGMFVSVSMAGGSDKKVLLVPERALGYDQNKKFAYVVDEFDKVVYREVELGSAINGQRVVLSGLQAGDRVVVSGTQHVRPDVLANPTEFVEKKPLIQQANNKVD